MSVWSNDQTVLPSNEQSNVSNSVGFNESRSTNKRAKLIYNDQLGSRVSMYLSVTNWMISQQQEFLMKHRMTIKWSELIIVDAMVTWLSLVSVTKYFLTSLSEKKQWDRFYTNRRNLYFGNFPRIFFWHIIVFYLKKMLCMFSYFVCESLLFWYFITSVLCSMCPSCNNNGWPSFCRQKAGKILRHKKS